MNAVPSLAFGNLGSRLEDVDQLMAAHAEMGGAERGRRFNVEGLNRAAIVMLCAHFEGYLEEVLSEAVQALDSKLDAGVLTARFNQPTPKNVDNLFAFLGMNKPSQGVSWRKAGNDTVRSNLNSLVETRNKIAHGTTGLTVHKADVTRYRKYVVGFCERFDALVRHQVHALTGRYPWLA